MPYSAIIIIYSEEKLWLLKINLRAPKSSRLKRKKLRKRSTFKKSLMKLPWSHFLAATLLLGYLRKKSHMTNIKLTRVRGNSHFSLCRNDSNKNIPVATDTFKLDTDPCIGILTNISQLSRVNRRKPAPSAPNTIATDPVNSTS